MKKANRPYIVEETEAKNTLTNAMEIFRYMMMNSQ